MGPELSDSKSFLPEALQKYDFWTMVCDLIDYGIAPGLSANEDVVYKYIRPEIVREEVIKEILIEMGYGYLVDLMDTITNYSFNDLLSFFAWVQQMKGSKLGYQLTLKLLGLDVALQEWWESGEPTPWTHDIVILIDTSYIKDIDLTLQKVRDFSRNYVYSHLDTIRLTYTPDIFASNKAVMGGFSMSLSKGNWFARTDRNPIYCGYRCTSTTCSTNVPLVPLME